MAKGTRDGRWSENERGEAVFHRPEGGTVTYGHDGSVVTEHPTPQGHHETVERAGERIERDVRLLEVKGFGPTETHETVSITTHHADGSVSREQHTHPVLPDDDSRFRTAEPSGPASGAPPSYDVARGVGGESTETAGAAHVSSSAEAPSVPPHSPGGWEYDPTETPEQNAAAAAAWDDVQRGPDWSALGDAVGSFAMDVVKVARPAENEVVNTTRYGIAAVQLGAAVVTGDRPGIAEGLTSVEMVGLDLVPGSDALAGAWDLNAMVLRAGGSSEANAPTAGQTMDAEIRAPLAAANAALVATVTGTGGGLDPSVLAEAGGPMIPLFQDQSPSSDATGTADFTPPPTSENGQAGITPSPDDGSGIGGPPADLTPPPTDTSPSDPGQPTDNHTAPDAGHTDPGSTAEPGPTAPDSPGSDHEDGGPRGVPTSDTTPHDVSATDGTPHQAPTNDREPTDSTTGHHDSPGAAEQTRPDDGSASPDGMHDLSPSDHAPATEGAPSDVQAPAFESSELQPAESAPPPPSATDTAPDSHAGPAEQQPDNTPPPAQQQAGPTHPGMDHHDDYVFGD